MEFFGNEFLKMPEKTEEPERELVSDEKDESPLNQKKRLDDESISIKRELVKMVELFINENSNLADEQKKQQLEKFTESLELAIDIHSDQKPRPDGPYVNHILRVSTRIVEEYGIKDIELVIAALLHDSIEDQSKKLADLSGNQEDISEREKALLFINNNFGERVKNTVFKLTNAEYEDKNISQDQKNKIYLEHVKEAIKDTDVLPIKLADFSDNALNLMSVKDNERRFKLSYKYLPVIECFLERLEKSQDIFDSNRLDKIKNNLEYAAHDIKRFINPQKIGGDGSSRNTEGRMGFLNWQVLFAGVSEIFLNKELIGSVESGKYNLLIADDASGRIPSLIFHKVIKELYKKNDFPNPKLFFVPGQRESIDPNISVKISNHINKYLEKVGLANTEINALVVTDVVFKGKSLKILSDALKKSNINCDIVALASHLNISELESLLDRKVYTIKDKKSHFGYGTYGVYNSHGVKKNTSEMVSRKIPGVQNDINQARRMVDKIAERMIDQINGKIKTSGDSFFDALKFVEKYWY